MKKKIAYILVALLIAVAGIGLGVSAFNNLNSNEPNTEVQGDGNEDNLSDEDLMKKAVAYVKTIYKDVAKETAQDFERIGTVPVGKTKFTVDWTVDVDETIIKVVKQDNGMVTIDINEEIGDETPYILTATISDGKGNKESLTWDHVIPAKLTGSMQEIVDMAYALKNGESLPNVATLQGSVISVNTPWDSGYKNITVTIVVEGREDKPIQCYRLKSGAADASDIEEGDLITVTGTLKNYNGTIEFDVGCVLDENLKGQGKITTLAGTMQEIVDKAYALKPGEMIGEVAILTGSVTKVNTPYDEGYKNVTVTIVVEGREDKPIQCYRMKGAEASKVAAGDLITVKGNLKNYNGTIEFDAGCQLTKLVKGGGKVTIETPKPTTSTELGRSLMTGDKVVIYAPAYGKALSVDKVSTYYNAGKTVSVKDGKMTGYGANEIFTVTRNNDGTYTFTNSGKKLGVDPEHTNMVLDKGNDKWEVIELGKGLYNIKNVGRETYIEWYDSMENFSTYNKATDDQFELSFYIVEASPEASKTFTVDEAKAEIVAKYATAPTEYAGNFDRITTHAMGASKFTITWTVNPTSIATVKDNGDGTCTIQVAKVSEDTDFVLTATIKDAKGNTATATWEYVAKYVAPINVGDEVVIWVPTDKAALSTEKKSPDKLDSYLVGKDITVSGETVYCNDNTPSWIIEDGGNGTVRFRDEASGKYLGINIVDTDTKTDVRVLDLGGQYNRWELVHLGSGVYNVRNVDCPDAGYGDYYLEWYNGFTVWSDSAADAAADAKFQVKIYVISDEVEAATAEDALAVLLSDMDGKEFTEEGNYTLLPSVTLGDATFNVTWESDNNLVATFVEDKLVITPSTTQDEEFTLTATVTNVDDATDTVSEDFGPYEVPMVEPEPEEPLFEDGDQVVIYAPAYGKALSATKAGNYNAGVDVIVEDGTINGYGDTEIWTVTVNDDGTVTFVNGDNTLSMNDQYTSLQYNADHDTWAVADLGNGLYTVKNATRTSSYGDCFLQWSSYGNWSTYGSSDDAAATSDRTQLAFYVVPEPLFEDGDKVVIYAPAYGKALSATKAGNYNAGVDVTVEDGTVNGYGDTEIWTVTVNDDGTVTFVNGDNTLSMNDQYTSLQYNADHDTWAVADLGNGLYTVKNATRTSSYGDCFLQWSSYGNWSTYGSSDDAAATSDRTQLAFYVVPEPLFEDGDQVVIYAPAYGKALSATKAGNYNAGVDVTVEDGTVNGYGDTEIWTVTVNDDGTVTFVNGNNTLSMNDQYTSLQYNADHDTWTVADLGNGLYTVKNATRTSSYGDCFLQWSSYGNWSTYGSSDDAAAASDRTQLAFCVLPEGTGDGTETPTEGGYFVKVTEAPTDWSGTYLIVYEDAQKVFDGSLTTLDATGNYKTVTITDGKIEATAETKAVQFTIETSGSAYTIKSASGYYIGREGNSNGLASSTSAAYTNTLLMDSDGNVNILSSGGAYLRFNAGTAENEDRFRYYKSSSYTNQQAISLYKLVEE